MRHLTFWWGVFSGFLEPLMYLIALGVGVGALVGNLPQQSDEPVTYTAFVAPGILAVSVLNGVLGEAAFHFFVKMRPMRLYDVVIATPVTAKELAVGELAWAIVRGALYAASFLLIMLAMGVTTPLRALGGFGATLVVAFAFGTAGIALGTRLRHFNDATYLNVAQFGLFLISGTFAPVSLYPDVITAIVTLTPVYHAVELTRALTLGQVGPGVLVNLAYLLVMGGIGYVLAVRWTSRAMYQ